MWTVVRHQLSSWNYVCHFLLGLALVCVTRPSHHGFLVIGLPFGLAVDPFRSIDVGLSLNVARVTPRDSFLLARPACLSQP